MLVALNRNEESAFWLLAALVEDILFQVGLCVRARVRVRVCVCVCVRACTCAGVWVGCVRVGGCVTMGVAGEGQEGCGDWQRW